MELRRFGKTDIYVSVLGFGGAEIGYERAQEAVVRDLLTGALDAGCNVVDTAECYRDSESLIGNTIATRRTEYFLFTKCGHVDTGNTEDYSEPALLKSIERSLRRLKTEYVDLVLLHSCSEDILRRGEAIQALQKARDKGHTRYIGYSGDNAAAVYAIECGAFDALETSVSIADQEALDLVLPKAREAGLGVIAKRPIANAAWRTGKEPVSAYHRPYWERLQKLDYDFLKDGVEQGVEVALRFTYSVPGIHTMIVGTTRPGRFRSNAELLKKGSLPGEQFEAIRRRWKEVADSSWVGQV